MNIQNSKSKVSMLRATSLNYDLLQENNEKLETNIQTVEEQSQSPSHKQQNVHQFILSEFKEKYDLLKNQLEVKKKEADSLLYDKKKLQIEILSHNVQYYDKQISRLREEVEKFQYENQENKHRYFLAENARKDLESGLKNRQQQLKRILKQLQNEKIAVVQLKHQLAEKDRTYMQVMNDMSKSNQQISSKYEECLSKLSKAEGELKVRQVENDQVKRQNERKEQQIKRMTQEFNEKKERMDLIEYRLKNRVEDLEYALRQSDNKENQIVKNMELRIRELEERLKSEDLLLAQKNQTAVQFKNIRTKERQIAKLEDDNRQLYFQLQQKLRIIQDLEVKLSSVCSSEDLAKAEEELADLQNKKLGSERLYQSKIIELQKEIDMLRLTSFKNPAQQYASNNDFQTLLKHQMQENTKLRKELSDKIDEMFNLRTQLEQSEARQSLLENQIDILKKKQVTQQKNIRISFEIDQQNLVNEIDTLRRKLEGLQTKLAIKTKETKDKDGFIMSTIVGRSRQEDVPFIMAEFQRVFQAQYNQKLAQAEQKIRILQNK